MTAVIGTPNDLINKIQEMTDVTGGFGTAYKVRKRYENHRYHGQ
jgi:hypothetical protein